jgi:hypothetical protein
MAINKREILLTNISPGPQGAGGHDVQDTGFEAVDGVVPDAPASL